MDEWKQRLQACIVNGGDFPAESIHYSTLIDWIRKIKKGENILVRNTGSGPSSDGIIDQKICLELNDYPFHSLRTVSTCLKIPKGTIYDHLKKMGFIVKHIKFNFHTLNSEQKLDRVRLAKQLLEVIAQEPHQSWRYFLTGDESFFFFIEDIAIQCVAPKQKPFQRPISYRLVEEYVNESVYFNNNGDMNLIN